MEINGGCFDQYARKRLKMLTLKVKNKLMVCLILPGLVYQANAHHQHHAPDYSSAVNFSTLPAPLQKPATEQMRYGFIKNS
jgi:hypothetical protein